MAENPTGECEIREGESIVSLVRLVRHRLDAAGVPSSQLDARLLVCAAAGLTHEQFIADPGRRLDAREAGLLEEMVTRRTSREPVSRIVGNREFWGRRFEITPETLDPRADSETLVETVLNDLGLAEREAPLIADLGTGSGCLLITLLCEIHHARGVGVDIDLRAAAAARRNAHAHDVAARAMFVCGNWLTALKSGFDLIISNPPYIRSRDIADLEPEVVRYEPIRALDGGADGLDCYRKISHEVRNQIRKNGCLVFELGMGQHDDVADILKKDGYTVKGMSQDLSGTVRCLWATPSA